MTKKLAVDTNGNITNPTLRFLESEYTSTLSLYCSTHKRIMRRLAASCVLCYLQPHHPIYELTLR